MLRNSSFIPHYTDLGDLVNLGDFSGQLVDPTNPTNRSDRSDQPDQPIRPTRPTDPIWGISIKCGVLVIFALERVVDTYTCQVAQSW